MDYDGNGAISQQEFLDYYPKLNTRQETTDRSVMTDVTPEAARTGQGAVVTRAPAASFPREDVVDVVDAETEAMSLAVDQPTGPKDPR